MKVRPCCASGGAHDPDDLTRLDAVSGLHGRGLHVVVRRDEAVSMVDLHTVAAAPGMPSSGTHHAGVGRVDPGSFGSGKVLAPVELAGLTREGIDAIAEGRSRNEGFQGGVELPLRGARQVRGGDDDGT
jgi:hypothetical protein